MSAVPDLAVNLYSLQGGGAERVALTLANGAARRGLAVEIVACRAEGPFLDEIHPAITVVDLEADDSRAWRKGLAEYLVHRTPRSLLSIMAGANVVGLLAHRDARSGARHVVTVHNTMSRHTRAGASLKERHLLPWFIRALYRRADEVVAVSAGVADDLSRMAWLNRNRITVVHNPVVRDEMDALAHEQTGHPWVDEDGGPPVLLGVGRLTPQKDFPTLLRAFASLTRNRDARLIILGEGPEREELERLVAELSLTERVSLPGFTTNPFPWLRGADLFVLSSAWEGFGNVLVEAMALGTPVVSTDCPNGPSEILEGGRYGALVPVDDPEALAQAMADALDAPPHPDALRKRAATFHEDPVLDRYLELLGLGGRQ